VNEMMPNIYSQQISDEDFIRLSKTIYNICGILLPESKKVLVEGRVRKRVKETGLPSYQAYMKYLFTETGKEKELIPLIDMITTNKTDFYRENAHFEFLVETALPLLISVIKNSHKNPFMQFWSAGCSTGEEPYTLAIILNEYFARFRDFQFQIHASDISTDVLKKAALGIFEYEKIDVIPEQLKIKYLLKSKDPEKKIVRFVSEIRRQINFSRINLMDQNYDMPDLLDVVFCRNVLIYFDKQTQEAVIRKLAGKMKTGGYLFLGHSESIMGMKVPLERAASTIYVKI
jgi:chemotaxis protein methyltransferase CheR